MAAAQGLEAPRLLVCEKEGEGLAAICLNALVNHRRCEWTFQRKPLELDDERMVAGVVDVLMRLAVGGNG